MVERIELENLIILYKNDDEELHREDGPAVIWPDGRKEWWINGIPYIYSEWKKEILKRKLKNFQKSQSRICILSLIFIHLYYIDNKNQK